MNSKGTPVAGMNVQREIERLAHELSKKRENVNGSGLEDWLEAERIVAEWLKDHEKKEDAKDAQKKKQGPQPIS